MLSPIEIQQAATEALHKMGADIEPSKVYTFDGNLDGKKVFDSDFGTLVKMDGATRDLTKAEAFFSFVKDGSSASKPCITMKEGDTTAVIYEETIYAIGFGENSSELYGLKEGVYFVYHSDTHYATRIQLNETIHPVDDKFLPGVCLSLVEITSEVNDGTIFNETESAALDAACGKPAIIKNGNSMMLTEYLETDGMQIFMPVSAMMSGYMFAKTEGMWVAMQTE